MRSLVGLEQGAVVGALILCCMACSEGGPRRSNEGLQSDGGDASIDGGVSPDSGQPDAGEDADAGWLTATPPGIDCSRPEDAQTFWCTPICYEADVDLGWAERVRLKTRPGRHHPSKNCYSEYYPTGSYLWRAPYRGKWVIDTFGAEGGFLFGVDSALCRAPVYACSIPPVAVMELDEGEPVVALTKVYYGLEDIGPSIDQVNISPWVEHEQGADCADIADNDGDGKPDCYDPDCASEPVCNSELCANEIIPSQVPVRVEGELTEAGHANRYRWCGDEKTRERVFAWQAPATGRYVMDASRSSFIKSFSMSKGSCIGPQVGDYCRVDDPYSTERTAAAQGFDAVQGEWFIAFLGGSDDTIAFGRRDQPPRTHYVLEVREAADEGAHCFDRVDNDGNGLVDQSDPACGGD